MSQDPNWRDNDNKEMDVDSPFLPWRWNGFRYERIRWTKIRELDRSKFKVLVWDEYHGNHGMDRYLLLNWCVSNLLVLPHINLVYLL
jgi:hypothetical protein